MNPENDIPAILAEYIEQYPDNYILKEVAEDFKKHPDHHMAWKDRDTGYICLTRRPHVIRNPTPMINRVFFNWCGYVLIDENNQFYGKNFDDKSIDLLNSGDDLTFSNHIPFFFSDEWAFGFDFAHGCDICDLYGALEWGKFSYSVNFPSYKNFAYVKEKCTELARELYEKR